MNAVRRPDWRTPRRGTEDGTALPTTITATLTWNGTAQTPVTYNTTGFSPGDLLLLAQQVTSAVTTTGRYDWSLSVTLNYTTPVTLPGSGTAFVVAQDASFFGAGWTLSTVNQLVSTFPTTPPAAPRQAS